MIIQFFKPEGPSGFLSNYFRWPFVLECRRWENVEHCYQAAKFVHDPARFTAICRHADPDAAKGFAREHRAAWRPDWNRVKVPVMQRALRAKFGQSGLLTQALLATGDATLEEASPYDAFWGIGPSGNGENRLGRLLMELRAELRRDA